MLPRLSGNLTGYQCDEMGTILDLKIKCYSLPFIIIIYIFSKLTFHRRPSTAGAFQQTRACVRADGRRWKVNLEKIAHANPNLIFNSLAHDVRTLVARCSTPRVLNGVEHGQHFPTLYVDLRFFSPCKRH